jgi:hypothetical protein
VRILSRFSEKACVEIETVRKNLQRLYEQLAMTNDTAREIARNELCRGPVKRFELAKREAIELAELIILARKSSQSPHGRPVRAGRGGRHEGGHAKSQRPEYCAHQRRGSNED